MTDSTFFKDLESLQQRYQRALPPVAQWNPPLSGDMDMRIASDGRWFHEGDEIKRQPLANLFSTILKREGDDYFLVTPVEKWKIQVDDAPFLVVDFQHVEATDDGQKEHFIFVTNNDDKVVADADHPLWVNYVGDGDKAEPKPYLMVRNNLPGLLHRKVYYQLVEQALIGEEENPGIRSCGEFFQLS